jgi:hypothetical protein
MISKFMFLILDTREMSIEVEKVLQMSIEARKSPGRNLSTTSKRTPKSFVQFLL